MKILTGNTYAHKEKIKSMGGKWSGNTWAVPDEAYEELQRLCSSAKKMGDYLDKPTYCGSGQKFECGDCCDRVYPGTQCWETGLIHRRNMYD